MPTYHVPKPGERPDVLVEIDDVWLSGELRMWVHDDDGTWSAQVQWRPAGTHTRRIDTFPQPRVRLDDVPGGPVAVGVASPGGSILWDGESAESPQESRRRSPTATGSNAVVAGQSGGGS